MGLYINEDSKGNKLPAIGKVQALLNDGAEIAEPVYQDNLICVVENDNIAGKFDAAGYMFSKVEFDYFDEITNRKKTWLIHPKAKELAK